MSRILEIFACGIRISWKFLRVESGILEMFACGIRNLGNICLWNPESWYIFAGGIRNLGNFCMWNPESWKCLPVESGILGLGIRNPTNNWNPSSTEKDLDSCTWNPESMAWSPESKTALNSFTWGETELSYNTSTLKNPNRVKSPVLSPFLMDWSKMSLSFSWKDYRETKEKWNQSYKPTPCTYLEQH